MKYSTLALAVSDAELNIYHVIDISFGEQTSPLFPQAVRLFLCVHAHLFKVIFRMGIWSKINVQRKFYKLTVKCVIAIAANLNHWKLWGYFPVE